jgi:hypothetical protein
MKVRGKFNMSPQLVREAVAASVAESNCAPADREKFLNACLPVPLPKSINVDEFHAANLGVAAGEHPVWFVVQGDPQSVFFDEETGRFGACWGPDRDRGTYDDLGFRSRDPVEMFLV